MGKTLQNQDSGVSLESTNPGCIKGLFHRFSNRKWNNVKRRLPYRRHSTGKLPAVGDSGNDTNNITDTHEEQGKTDDGVANSTEKLSEPGSRHKGSMKSRIKALIVEELSKRKGRHRRSSSLPSPIFERSPSIHHLEASDQDPQFEVQLEDERLDYQDNLHSSVSSLLDPLLPNISDESLMSRKTCNLCAATLATHYFRQSEAYAKRAVKDHILPEDKSIASLQESELSPDAVDLLDIRKELFLKVFQDPNSLLCHRLHAQNACIQKLGLRKFASFPVSHSFSKGVPMLNSGENNGEVGTSTEGKTTMKVGNGDRISDIFAYIDELSRHSATCHCDHHVVVWSKLLDNLTLDPQSSENQQNKELSYKHFKRLREKVKHSIEEPKKGRHRIIMDAILHKVPYGRRYWKNVKENGGNIHSDKMTEKGHNNGSGSRSYSPFGKNRPQRFSRASSFNGPCERYNQLLDSHCNTETNSCPSDTLRLRTSSPSPIRSSPKLLERILSLPNLRSYSFSRIEGAPVDYSSMSPMRPVLACIPSIGSRRSCDSRATSFKIQIQSTNSSENGSQENFVEGSDTFKDSSESERGEGSYHHNRFIESPLGSVSISTPESDANAKGSARSSTGKDPELMPQDSILYERGTLSSLQLELSTEFPKETIVVSRVETPTCSSSSDKMRLHFEVDKRNEAEFNYVKDVLERSGFSRNELFGSRHSGEQRVDGSVFAEVGAKLDEFPENEGSGSCYKLVLFDLIKQVLSEIHDRSFSYWPAPITCRSRIHPMPIGQCVLEEVWRDIEGYLTPVPVFDPSLDDAVTRDLAKDDGWMNIQFEAEGAALELEDMIFHDLVLELVLP